MTTGDRRMQSGRWRQLRLAVLARDRYTCRIAGPRCSVRATTVDHVVPLSEGGAMWDPANLRAACGACNYGRVHPARLVGRRPARWRYHVAVVDPVTRL